jgi:hypothetical protein
MGNDITRNPSQEAKEIIEASPHLRLKKKKIELSTKLNQYNSIVVEISKLLEEKVPKLQLDQHVLSEQIETLKNDILELSRQTGQEEPKLLEANFISDK